MSGWGEGLAGEKREVNQNVINPNYTRIRHQTASKKNAFDALELGIDLDFVVEGSRFVSRGRKVIEIESVKSEEKKTPYTLTL